MACRWFHTLVLHQIKLCFVLQPQLPGVVQLHQCCKTSTSQTRCSGLFLTNVWLPTVWPFSYMPGLPADMLQWCGQALDQIEASSLYYDENGQIGISTALIALFAPSSMRG